MSAEPRDFLDAEICLWCGNYSCTCEDAPEPAELTIAGVVAAIAHSNWGSPD